MRLNKFHAFKLNLDTQGKTIHSLQAKLDTLTKELMSTKNLADSFQKQNDVLSKQLKKAFAKCSAVKEDFQKTEEELKHARE